MRLLITGFSNSGKTTIFNALTGLNLPVTIYPTLITEKAEPHTGIVNVPDERVQRLSAIFKPKKTTHTVIECIDYAGLTKEGATQNSKVFNLLKDADAIVHVVRAFEDLQVLHPLGDVNPQRDVKAFESELILKDLEIVERRLERIDLSLKKGKREDAPGEKELLGKCKKTLENEIPLREINLNEEERRLMQTYQFLSQKPEVILLNIGECDIEGEKVTQLEEDIKRCFVGDDSCREGKELSPFLTVCGKTEIEIAELSEEERVVFLEELKIKEPILKRFCRAVYEALHMITFFTVVKNEVRAWAIKKGTNALKAAGKIHSDMEKGFIKAEVINFDDFVSSGESMAEAKSRGLVRLEGKDYIVKEGDIINFRFAP